MRSNTCSVALPQSPYAPRQRILSKYQPNTIGKRAWFLLSGRPTKKWTGANHRIKPGNKIGHETHSSSCRAECEQTLQK